jgi:hypothetical protein
MSVTPQPGLTSEVATGGIAVEVVPGGPNGGFITNPAASGDQGLGAAEPLTINPVTAAGVGGAGGSGEGNGTNFVLTPGQSWTIIPGQTTPTSVNALTSGHKFSVVWF